MLSDIPWMVHWEGGNKTFGSNQNGTREAGAVQSSSGSLVLAAT